MPVQTRFAPRVADADAAEKRKASDTNATTDTCAICLSTIGCASEVRLVCNHKFHGQCVARHLQLDRRCPVCRKAPRTAIDDQEDDADAAQDIIDASEGTTIMRLLKKASTTTMRAMLKEFAVPEAESERDKEVLAELLSKQLHYETDDE
jgi:hypothetical protein